MLILTITKENHRRQNTNYKPQRKKKKPEKNLQLRWSERFQKYTKRKQYIENAQSFEKRTIN